MHGKKSEVDLVRELAMKLHARLRQQQLRIGRRRHAAGTVRLVDHGPHAGRNIGH